MLEKLRKYFHSAKVLPEHKERIKKLEGIVGASIDNPFLYIRALRHRSILADENFTAADSYERLEFLGDTVLDMVVTEIIFEQFPGEDEGFLTKLRAKLVSGDALARYAEHLNLNDLLVIGERAQGQGIELSKSVLSDVFEALIGALYLDKGYTFTSSFVSRIIQQYIDFDKLIGSLDNHKSILLEYAQAEKMSIPEYEVVTEEGPGHDKTFTIRVLVDGKECGSGTGKSKKEAEQLAAKQALAKFNAGGDTG